MTYDTYRKREVNRVFAAKKRALAKIPKQRTSSPLERWVDQAACAGMDIELFFPEQKAGMDRTHERPRLARALLICASCPVLEQCKTDALERRDTWGVRGGMTPGELMAAIGRTRQGK